MSDVLLTEISKKLSDIHVALTKGGAAPATSANAGGKPDTTAAKALADKKAAEAVAKKAEDDKKAAAAKAAADKAAKGPVAGTKAPGGKHTIEEVRDIIRKVAADKNLGRESAKDILRDDGGGVEKIPDLKPENYDKVYEACQVLLSGEGGAPSAAEPEDDFS